MSKILYVTDLHGKEEFYEKVLDIAVKEKVKAIIIGGDIAPRANKASLDFAVKFQRDFIEKFIIKKLKEFKKNNIGVFIMMGNDDFRVNMDLLKKAEKEGILKIIHNKLNKINDKFIIGYSFVNPTPFLLKDWEKVDFRGDKQITDPKDDIRTMPKEEGTVIDDLNKLGKLADAKKTIYVIHTPPHNTSLDLTNLEVHVGSKAVKRFIEKEQPLMCLHGHIHESVGKEKIGKTIAINPGNEHCIIIDIDNLKIEKVVGLK